MTAQEAAAAAAKAIAEAEAAIAEAEEAAREAEAAEAEAEAAQVFAQAAMNALQSGTLSQWYVSYSSIFLATAPRKDADLEYDFCTKANLRQMFPI